MKTINLLKAAMLCIATLCAAGAMAQTPTQILGVYENVDEIIYQTTDKKLRLYVAPDPLYSPGYDATDNSGINGQSEWRWEKAGWTGTSNEIKPWTNENWLEMPVTESLTIHVKERFGTAGCEGSTATTKQIIAVGKPSATFGTLTMTGWEDEGSNTWSKCSNGDDVIVKIPINITESSAHINARTYGTTYTTTLYEVDNAGNWKPNGTPQSTLSADASTLAITVDNNTNNGEISFTLPMLKASGSTPVRTKYVIEFEGKLQSKITQLSDYRAYVAGGGTGNPATYTSYDFPGSTFTFILNPLPKTGPIYHIPNNF